MPLPETMEPDKAVGTFASIFLIFLRLGLISFGGPVAHLGYFRDEFVTRRRWVDDRHYADLVSLCQFLPGPASSQVGFSLGLLRGNGLIGGLAAWLGFTLPSAVLMLGFGLGAALLAGPTADAIVHGLKLVAAAIVAQALWGMTRSLVPDLPRALIALAALAISLAVGGFLGQIGPIVLGGLFGAYFCTAKAGMAPSSLPVPVSRQAGLAAVAAAMLLFVALPLAATLGGGAHIVGQFNAFYQSGALVFGGGHVVLPLLQASVVEPGWVSQESFLAGYGLAQALPGPLFTFAAYLGASMAPGFAGIVLGLMALIAIFLPGLLLVYGALPFVGALRANARTDAAMQGTNAAVVGVLAAAFYDPVLVGSLFSLFDACLALASFAVLVFARAPSWAVVLLVPAVMLVRAYL
ncbi:chromate transporter [Mesorhizobium sp. Root554]|uniref:chromate efflux transporter n=1 Tax=unclassified Mesorhizobium TaxID=325217 RepID=UPI0006FD90AB|nr:chromate efflux transporter [Mesorhizobium sp. Root1471]KQZ13710.1 chromate transporter [Mesorhizobium sp. Root1471]KQZ36221.1 chromate transporter [Mesorhizobium sp. Root554]